MSEEFHAVPHQPHSHQGPDPRKTADWWVGAFGFEILSDETRVFGDRFVRCRAQEGGALVTFSNARTGETLGPGSASPRFGLEHFAIDTENIDADIARLQGLGAKLQEGPLQLPNGARFAFLTAPDDVRLELVEPPKAAAR